MRKLSLLLPILALVVAFSVGTAGANATSPALTNTEYHEFLAFESSLSHTARTLAAFKRAQKTCRGLTPVSALMRAGRADCNAAFGWYEASAEALLRVKACAPRKTVGGRFSCLLPAYARLTRKVHVLYHAEKRMYRATVKRGFTGACMRALSPGPRSLRDEAHMSADASKLLAAMRRRNLLAAEKWGSLYDAAVAEAQSAGSHTSVAVCPHQ